MKNGTHKNQALGRAVMLALTALCLATVTVVVAPGASATPLPPVGFKCLIFDGIILCPHVPNPEP